VAKPACLRTWQNAPKSAFVSKDAEKEIRRSLPRRGPLAKLIFHKVAKSSVTGPGDEHPEPVSIGRVGIETGIGIVGIETIGG